MRPPEVDPGEFRAAAETYIDALGEKYRDALALHEEPGKLWEKDANGKDWRNVTDHCLMEAARAEIFSKKLDLPPGVAQDLAVAAALHDFCKKFDIQYTKEDIAAGGSGRRGYLRSERESGAILRKAGFSERIIRISESTNGEPETLMAIKKIIGVDEISDDDLAYVVLHYIDGYTTGSELVAPAEKHMNDIDRRMMRNAENPDYRKMNQEALISYKGIPGFEGKTRFEAQAMVGHLIEDKLTKLIHARTGEKIHPRRLPEIIDEALRRAIKVAS